MEETTSLKKTARIAGVLSLIVTLTAPFSLLYGPSRTIVSGNASATADKILANEFLFRSGIVVGLISTVVFVIYALVLYKLLKPVNTHLARVMVILLAIQIPVDLVLNAFSITSLMILKGQALPSLIDSQRAEMATLFLKIGSYGTRLLEIFWGLWLIPFGQLVYRSRFIPRFFGIYLIANGIAYVLMAISFLQFPDYRSMLETYTLPFLFGEVAIMLWFLIKGVSDHGAQLTSEQR